MDRQALEIALVGIQRRIEELEAELLMTQKAKQSLSRSLRDLKEQGLPFGKSGKRLQKGFPRTAIMKIMLGNSGHSYTWEGIQREIRSKYGIVMNRSTILNNLNSLADSGEISREEEENKWTAATLPVEEEGAAEEIEESDIDENERG